MHRQVAVYVVVVDLIKHPLTTWVGVADKKKQCIDGSRLRQLKREYSITALVLVPHFAPPTEVIYDVNRNLWSTCLKEIIVYFSVKSKAVVTLQISYRTSSVQMWECELVMILLTTTGGKYPTDDIIYITR